ncbi:hypothetical protein [Streptomyces sp. NPDC003006]
MKSYKERIAQFLADPLKVTVNVNVNGIATVANSPDLTALDRRLAQLDAATAPAPCLWLGMLASLGRFWIVGGGGLP